MRLLNSKFSRFKSAAIFNQKYLGNLLGFPLKNGGQSHQSQLTCYHFLKILKLSAKFTHPSDTNIYYSVILSFLLDSPCLKISFCYQARIGVEFYH